MSGCSWSICRALAPPSRVLAPPKCALFEHHVHMFSLGAFLSRVRSIALRGDGLILARDPAVMAQIRSAQFRSLNQMLPLMMLMGAGSSMVLFAVLHQDIGTGPMATWLGLRLLVNAARAAYAALCNRGLLSAGREDFETSVLLAMADGIVWGALGWWLTPVDRLDLAVVIIPMTVIVTCLGVLGMHVHMPSSMAFMLPITLPNALRALHRHDQLGWLCFAALIGLSVVLTLELWRFNRGYQEIVRLRFESEQATQAKSDALRQAQALADTRSRFVATMSHELRTPLHGMLGLLRLALAADTLPQAQRHLRLMQGSGDHLAKVINEVLDHARMESTGLPIANAPLDVKALLAELSEQVRPACQDKGLHFMLDDQLERTTWVMGDATRLRQVLHNLLGNALKFTASGGITLSVSRVQGSSPSESLLRLQVRDTGVGIAAHELDRVFEPFHQAEGTYERQFGGTGLGLTISRELCVAMGGQLSCSSQPGQGSVFTCELPLPEVLATAPERVQLPVQHPLHTTQAPHALSGLEAAGIQVLVVEDNPVNTIVVEASLVQLGASVSCVSSGEAALVWLAERQADLILMDCEMPGMDGFEATQRIRAREQALALPRSPIVAMTASGRETFERRGRAAGMDEHLSKPFDQEALRRVLLAQCPQATHDQALVS
jgi:signal transduction histidine kinase/AmiR/NasT family two-component response regulator